MRYVLQRVLETIPTLLGISIVAFVLIRLVPGGMIDALLGSTVARTQVLVESIERFYGTERPIVVQYLDWLQALVLGDWGRSWQSGESVRTLIVSRFGLTFELALLAFLVSSLFGASVGILAAIHRGGWLDSGMRVISLTGLSVPGFWLGMVLLLITSKSLGWIPPIQYVGLLEDPLTNLSIVTLPALSLGLANAALMMRMTRSSLLEVLGDDYVRTARAKGLHSMAVLLRHAMRNALVPVVTVAGIQLGYLLGGTVVTEQVFTLPGVGRLLIDAIAVRDYPVVQGVLVFAGGLFVASNLLVDLIYVYLDPRLRHDRS
jgi:peptide/nickel transport system permease protein